MEAHRAAAIVSEDGSVTIRGVPFAEGEEVEVIVLPRERPAEAPPSLRGSVREYDAPFDAAEGDWEALQPAP